MHNTELLSSTVGRFADLGLPIGPVVPWLNQQLSRCTDPEFAALFADNIDLPGIHPADYLHKVIHTPLGALLGGIRFYNRDITKPFVELLAWTGPVDLPTWQASIISAWAMFQPQRFRVLVTNQPEFADALVDQSIHVGQAGAMAQRPTSAGIALAPCRHPAEAAALVAEWYRAFEIDQPVLAAEVHPADLDDLTACATNGTLDFITIDGIVAGLIATEPGEIDWVRGYVVIEEIMAPTHRGHGYAAQAQRLLAARLSETHGSESLIIGTIHHLNIASSRTATRAGRPGVMSYRFLSMS